MEQISYEREQQYLQEHKHEELKDGYGIIVLDTTIRDLKNVGLAHLGSQGRSLVKAALDVGVRK